MKKAIVIGASSGIGKELARVMAAEGCEVGIAARRTGLLEEIAAETPGIICTETIDVTDTGKAVRLLEKMIEKAGDVDTIIISSGTGYINPELNWQLEKMTIDTNVSGFAALAGASMNYFIKRGSGQLVGISSVSCLRGDADGPAYSASKAFDSNYLAGLRKKAVKAKLPIKVTDIRPGLVDTEMAKGDGLFWVAPPQKAALQIYKAICSGKKKAYVTKRWRLVAFILKIMPDFIYERL